MSKKGEDGGRKSLIVHREPCDKHDWSRRKFGSTGIAEFRKTSIRYLSLMRSHAPSPAFISQDFDSISLFGAVSFQHDSLSLLEPLLSRLQNNDFAIHSDEGNRPLVTL